ncbi:hypothetical protein PHMEG_00035630 [Phytophthora megakarya]|uniref:Uncharacterized protein n=1 Tax=Phytophthora megakarya TaxID=4795 RepID=A0A225UN94_9STRA|nr:hypothetical protein PHMEG_00035630 [Phytophthora megakarya]
MRGHFVPIEDIDARVGEVLENTTAEKTKYIYLRALARFVEWLYINTDVNGRQTMFPMVTPAYRLSKNFKADNYITPTGIPPHVGLMVELSGYKAEIAE